jgi:TRAP-type uncharacterized transport system fused permease subunit
MKGDAFSIALDLALAIAGVWFISAAMMGYAARPLGLAVRIVYCVAGMGIFWPANAFGAGRWINAAGVGLGVALIAWGKIVHRRAVAGA